MAKFGPIGPAGANPGPKWVVDQVSVATFRRPMELVDNPLPGPDPREPRPYLRRIRQLVVAHLILLCVSLPGLGLIVKGARPLVLTPHRSGSETLALAFFLLFFLYLVSLAVRGAWGALRFTLLMLRDAARRPARRALASHTRA